MIRILLADDETLIRDALAGLLGLEDDLEVVATAASGTEAVDAGRVHRPDVAVRIRDAMDPAALAPGVDHRAGASAGPAATPPIDRVIAQQQVQHGSGLALDRADPVDGVGPGVHGPA